MEQFGSYRIDKAVHTDEKFVIYQAKDSQEKSVYLKALRAEFPDLKDVARLQREHNLINQLDSKEIIKTLGLVRQGHQVAMVMEALPEAVTLQEYCKNKPCTVEEFLIIATQIAQGLMVLHENKIIHKDLIPSNVLFSKKNQLIKIIDFGISTQALKEKSEVAGLNVTNASLPYIAPEQTGWINTDLDYRADFYSLGCTFYEMLTGKPPFSAEKKSDFFKQHINQKLPPVNEINSAVPSVISNIIARLLEKEPEHRYQSSYGLYRDLIKCQGLGAKTDLTWSFPLAEDDVADRFIISNKLYGRAREISLLKQEIVNTNQQNKLKLITVSGFSGIGKTSLVKEAELQIKLTNGIFVSGKFDQYQRELPYHALTQAFNEIIDRAMQSDEKIYWLEVLKEAFGKNGRILIDVIPKLKNVLGDLPPVPELGTKESYNRFLATVNQFIQIFLKPGHPLVMFIDDLQWAPTASLNLLDEIAEKNKNNPLILILSYRSNEVDEAHPLTALLSTLDKISILNKIELLPLKKEDINKIIADSLHSHQKGCEDLAEIIFERSSGNPFFAGELLNNLHTQRLIDFDYESGEWRWDIEKIRAVRSSDNVVEFMISRLNQLPEFTRELLKKAACIGRQFDTTLLTQVSKNEEASVASELFESLKLGLLIPVISEDEEGDLYDTHATYQFQHDRIQQAAYEMIDANEKPAIHLLIGKTLQNNYRDSGIEDKIVSITDHMNKARILLSSESEKLELAKLNLAAGIRANESVAYHTAFEFLKIGISLLEPKSWNNHYRLTYDLFEHYSQNAFLSGELSEERTSNEMLLAHARTPLEKAKIYRMRAIQQIINGKSEEALDDCIKGLSLLNIKMKKKVTTFSVLVELMKTKYRQLFRSIPSLGNLPLMENPEKIVAMQLLVEMIAPCYVLGKKNLFAKSILRQVNLSIQYGNTKEAAYSYATYGLLLNAFFNQPNPAYEFGKMAVELNKKLDDVSLRARTLFVFYAFIYPWNRPIHTLYDMYPEIIKVAYQSGDLLYATYAIDQYSVLQPKDTLRNCTEIAKKYIETVGATKYDDSLLFIKTLQQFRLSLQDRENSDHFKIDSESEIEFVKNLRSLQFDSSITVYLIKKIEDCYFFSDYQKAYSLLNECEKSLEAQLSAVITEEFYVFAALTLARQYEKADSSEKKKILAQMNRHYQKVRKWASHCKLNFLQHAFLLEATILRVQNKKKKAALIYEKALAAAQENNFLHDEALICEEIGGEKYIKQAHYAYLQWGALAKVKQLELIYPYLK